MRVLRLTLLGLLAAVLPVPVAAQIIIGPGDPPCFVDNTQPKCHEPVLIIPGLGASYNRERMLKDDPGGEWEFAPTIDWFEPLIERLEAEGYEQGKDLLVVHYDWRQGNKISAIEFLMPAIDQALALHNPESGEVDVVAHSMGGLVVRAYAQSENLYRNDIDQIIFLGTPSQGAADTYIAWEGGEFPDRWSSGSRFWIRRIANGVRKSRNLDQVQPPLLWRTVFPSLKQLLPIGPYVTREGNQLQSSDMVEQNEFLQDLEDTKVRLAQRGISVTTIAGSEHGTLASLTVDQNRTAEDQTLERWRDGHPNPEPPPANSVAGDRTVLTSSVHSIGGDSVTLASTTHEELPGKGQDDVALRLVGNTSADTVPFTLASAGLGVDILSPAMPVLTGPNGEVLSADTNTFPDAVFDWDPSDLDGPKLLTITDPPPGDYTLTVTGTDTGPYDAIITYADGDETTTQEHRADTAVGTVHTYTFSLGDTAGPTLIVELPDVDIQDTLKEIIKEAKKAKKATKMRGHYRASITRPASHARADFRIYERRLKKGRESSAAKRLEDFYEELDEIEEATEKLLKKYPDQPNLLRILDLLTAIHRSAPSL